MSALRRGGGVRLAGLLLGIPLLACACSEGDTGSSTAYTDPFAPLDSLPPRRAVEPLGKEFRQITQSLARGEVERAIELAAARASKDPESAEVAFLLGIALAKADRQEEARRSFERALALDPGAVLPYDYLGQSLLRLGELGAAGEAFAAYRARDPRDPRSHYGSALITLETGERTLARRHLERAIELFEDLKRSDGVAWKGRSAEVSDCHARLGDLAFADGDYVTARTQLERAVALASRSASPYYKLGLVYRRLGQDELAAVAEARFQKLTFRGSPGSGAGR